MPNARTGTVMLLLWSALLAVPLVSPQTGKPAKTKRPGEWIGPTASPRIKISTRSHAYNIYIIYPLRDPVKNFLMFFFFGDRLLLIITYFIINGNNNYVLHILQSRYFVYFNS